MMTEEMKQNHRDSIRRVETTLTRFDTFLDWTGKYMKLNWANDSNRYSESIAMQIQRLKTSQLLQEMSKLTLNNQLAINDTSWKYVKVVPEHHEISKDSVKIGEIVRFQPTARKAN